jgi:protein-L-isoaspartate(D-aspartate) O-methyltransferase
VDLDAQRRRMIEHQLAARGVDDPRVLDAMRSVPRERFVPEGLTRHAYEDRALPIEAGQTISQPYMVGFMAQALRLEPADVVLEVGAGSGYAAAVMSRLVTHVYAIERRPSLVEAAADRLRALGFRNVTVILGDGVLGRPEHAPFEAISVAASASCVPDALREQLAVGGRLVMPVGDQSGFQRLVRVRREGEASYARETLGEVRFVPLVGGGIPGPPPAGWARG